MAFEDMENRPQDETIEAGNGAAEENTVTGENGPVQEPKKAKRKAGVIAAVAAAGVIAVAGGVFAFIKVTEKDPKEVVIQAFENIYTEDQVNPVEELFGLSGFAERVGEADVETGITLTLDSSSSADLDMFAGSGLKIEGLYDRTNKRSGAKVGIVYNGMDLLHADAYYGEDTLMVAVPELSSKVFSLDLSEGLAKRLKDSPMIGPMLEENDIDIEGIGAYMEELADSANAEVSGTGTPDLGDIVKRFQDGWQTREKLKAAMTVEKAEKKTFVIDEKEVNCKGYQVQISKEFMMEFLRGSTEFFLNDEELKEIYLKQLEQSVRMTELMGGMTYGRSAEQIYEDSMADMTGDIEEMIDFLDQTLNDVDMTVYVDKKGRLASVSGTTVLTAESGVESDNIQVDFEVELKGGSYLTQNLTADVKMKNENAQVDVEVKKQGSYDGTQLTDDISLDIDARSEQDYSIGIVYTDTYNADSGDYHVGTSVTANGYLIADLSLTGVVSQLEKGVSAQVDMDELRIVIMNETGRVTLSGEYYFRPLSEEVKAPDGEIFDVVAASEGEWKALGTEVFLKLLKISGQLGMTGQVEIP